MALERLLALLCDHGVDFIVVGGLAGVLHGAPIVTRDVDIVHSREAANVARLITALRAAGAVYRHQHGRRIEPRADALAGPGHNLFSTSLGDLDALGALGADDFSSLLAASELMDFNGWRLRVLSLERLIVLKRAAGRAKDLRMLPELEATLRRTRRRRGEA